MNVLGGYQAAIAKCRAAGVDGVFLKGADGGSNWVYDSQHSEQFTPVVIQAFHAAGLKVIGWQYVYGGNAANATWSTVAGEGASMVWMLDQGADGVCFDPEDEFQGKPSQAIQECQAVRAAHPTASLGYNPYPWPSSQPNQPWVQWNEYCDYCMPQVYQRQDIGGTPTVMLQEMEVDFARWASAWKASGAPPSPPLLLDWQGASWGATPTPDSDLTEAATISRAYPLIAFYDADAMTAGEWTALAQAVKIFKGV